MNIDLRSVKEIVKERADPPVEWTMGNSTVHCCGSDPTGRFERIIGKKPDPAIEQNEQELIEKMSVSELIDHIIERHHRVARNEIGRLRLLMERVCHRHRDQYPELADLRVLFGALCDDLGTHMRREEFHLFPYIKTVENAHANNAYLPFPRFGTIGNPIRMMMADHDTVADFMDEMRGLTNSFTAPRDACPNLKSLYKGLADLEKDLHKHVHLENNILYPAAILLEQDCFPAA